MSATLVTPKTTSGGEIITHLINATDGEGLHFDGAAGNIDIASPPDLGTKFSMEFIAQADVWDTSTLQHFFADFSDGSTNRFIFGTRNSPISGALGVYSLNAGSGGWVSFDTAPKVFDDLKVHHLTLTVDGTTALLYDNGNLAGTATIVSPAIDLATDAGIASDYNNGSHWFNGTLYRTRFWNKTLSQAEVTASFENATVPFADQWGAAAVGPGYDKIEGDFTYNLDTWDAVNTWNTQTWDGSAKNMDLAANATGQNCRTATLLVPGYSYRCFYTASATAGAPAFGYHNGSALVALPATGSGTSTISNGTQNTFDFVLPSNATGYFYIFSTTASDAVTIDDIHVILTGAVSDYDLAFANPTQSLMVQDRAGAADGTASATGVAQVTPIEQLNSKSARIGTTAATPADGELLVSGQVGIGGSPEAKLGIIDTGLNALADVGEHANYHAFVQGSVTDDQGAGIGFGGAADVGSAIISKRVGSNYKSDLLFYTKDSTVSTADPELRLTIDAAGQVQINDTSGSYGGQIVSASDAAGTATLSAINKATSGTARRLVDFFAGTGTSRIAYIETDGADLNIGGCNVGIGVDSPLQLLHLRATDNKSIILIEDSETNVAVGDITGGIWFQNDDAYGTDPHITATIEAVASDIYGSSDLVFSSSYVDVYPNKPIERMRISSDTGGVGIGIAPTNPLAVCPTQYSTGTASQSGTTVTGSGTTFTAAMVGGQFVYADGTTSGRITAYNSTTDLTVTTSQTVASQAYDIRYTALQVSTDGRVGLNTTAPGKLLSVRPSVSGDGILIYESDSLNYAMLSEGYTNYAKHTLYRYGDPCHIISSAGETVFNEPGHDLDFRVESDTVTNALALDGATGVVTFGAGIAFQAATTGTGTGTGYTLDSYEEGTWTPTQGTFGTWTTPTFTATYVKIGKLVQVNCLQTGGTIDPGGTLDTMGGFPFAAANRATCTLSNDSIGDLGIGFIYNNSTMYCKNNFGSQTSFSFSAVYMTA